MGIATRLVIVLFVIGLATKLSAQQSESDTHSALFRMPSIQTCGVVILDMTISEAPQKQLKSENKHEDTK
jgi:hypothetical protein